MGLQMINSKNNVAGYSANADIFGTGNTLVGILPPSRLVIYACFSSSAIFTARRTCPGATTSSEQLNQGIALQANVLYEFDYVWNIHLRTTGLAQKQW